MLGSVVREQPRAMWQHRGRVVKRSERHAEYTGLQGIGYRSRGPWERCQPPGANMIGYVTVTIPPSGCANDSP